MNSQDTWIKQRTLKWRAASSKHRQAKLREQKLQHRQQAIRQGLRHQNVLKSQTDRQEIHVFQKQQQDQQEQAGLAILMQKGLSIDDAVNYIKSKKEQYQIEQRMSN